jgi:MFS family permease
LLLLSGRSPVLHPNSEMSIPPPSHVGSLRQGLRGILNKRKQLPSAFDNAPQLRGIDPVNIRADLRAIFTLASGVSDGEWDKAILVAKAGSNAFINQPNDLIGDPQLRLEAVERDALRDEQDKLSSQRGMAAVIVTVALAAFLQGHVQSSINAASLYAQGLGLKPGDTGLQSRDFQLGTMNASPFLAAALLGAPLSLPTNYYLGRRGALMASAVLIVASSVASAFVKTWIELLGVRIIGGVGMGIKAVTAPILASETAAGFWRGSIMLTWQLWVACGIMVGFVVNLIVAQITGSLGLPLSSDDLAESDQHRQYQTSQWILGAPIVPSVGLFVAVFFCYESPRFYMRQDSPNFRPDQALAILLAIRPTRLQALRDLILIRWSTKEDLEVRHERGLTYVSQLRVVLHLSWQQCRTLFKTPRLRNAISSTCTVALAQQLCGINVFAFYSNTVFINGKHDSGVKLAMAYSFGCGMTFVASVTCLSNILLRSSQLLLWPWRHEDD